MNWRPLLIFVQSLILANIVEGQNLNTLDYGPKSYLFQTSDSALLKNLCSKYTIGTSSKSLGIYTIIGPIEQSDLRGLNVFEDQALEERSLTNDPLAQKQFYLNFAEMDKVWEIINKPSNLSSNGVVIAVLEPGIDVNHEDLQENIYINKNEIVNDGLDNDGNGHVDDYNGLNVETNRGGEHIKNTHGTWVAGIIGARSNNNKGITGMAPNVKLLPITGVNYISDIFKAYDYIFKEKQLYIQTKGQKGANIVATNLSLGTDGSSQSSTLINTWCDLYNTLGSVGIVSCGAAPNSDTDVGINFDLPTSCVSPYLINVTNIDTSGRLASRTGFSNKKIHIGAPGENIFGLSNNSKYGQESGTSGSTPQVASMLGVLASLDCKEYQSEIFLNPSKAARMLSESVLSGVKLSPFLKDKVISGGYLNAVNTLKVFKKHCSNLTFQYISQLKPLSFDDIIFNGYTITVKYSAPEYGDYMFTVTDLLGRSIFQNKVKYEEFGVNTINFEAPEERLYILILQGENEVLFKKILKF